MNKKLILSKPGYFLLISSFLFTLSCRVSEEKCVGPTPHIPSWTQSKYTNIQVGDSVKFTYTGEDELSEDMKVFWEFEGAYPFLSEEPVVWAIYSAPGCWKVRLTMAPKCPDKDRPFKEVDPAVCVIE